MKSTAKHETALEALQRVIKGRLPSGWEVGYLGGPGAGAWQVTGPERGILLPIDIREARTTEDVEAIAGTVLARIEASSHREQPHEPTATIQGLRHADAQRIAADVADILAEFGATTPKETIVAQSAGLVFPSRRVVCAIRLTEEHAPEGKRNDVFKALLSYGQTVHDSISTRIPQ